MSLSKTTWYEVERLLPGRGWVRVPAEKHHQPPDLQAEASRAGVHVKLVRVTETREVLARARPATADGVT